MYYFIIKSNTKAKLFNIYFTVNDNLNILERDTYFWVHLFENCFAENKAQRILERLHDLQK